MWKRKIHKYYIVVSYTVYNRVGIVGSITTKYTLYKYIHKKEVTRVNVDWEDVKRKCIQSKPRVVVITYELSSQEHYEGFVQIIIIQ
jgi:hypothetical protein